MLYPLRPHARPSARPRVSPVRLEFLDSVCALRSISQQL